MSTDWRARLEQALTQVERPGEYHAHGTHVTPMPALTVEGAGQLSFPLVPAQVQAAVAHAQPAPYGRGEQTLYDPEIRRVWQLEPERFTLDARWQGTLDHIVQSACVGLGVADAVHAELYKLLVYEPGDFFAEHRDTEKTDGMFATLVVVLPGAFSGGELVVRHGDREAVLPLRSDDVGAVTWAAFYADCRHEIWPLLDGYRLCLIYNLVRDDPAVPVTAPDNRPLIAPVADHLRAWPADAPDQLLCVLEHGYSTAELSVAGLKNRDAALASVLAAAAEAAGCDAHLGMLALEEYGSAEHGWQRGEFEVQEVLDGQCTVGHLRTLNDTPVALGSLPVDPETDLLPPDALDDASPDHEAFHEATGNEGASFERTYRKAAVVLWPRQRRGAVYARLPQVEALTLLPSLVKTDPDTARGMAAGLVTRWQAPYNPDTADGALTLLLEALIDLRDQASLRQLIADHTGPTFGPRTAARLPDALALLGWDAALLREQISGVALHGWATCLAGLRARPESGAQAAWAALLPTLVACLPADSTKASFHTRLHSHPRRRLRPEAILALAAATAGAPAALLEECLTHLTAHPGRFHPDDLLLEACLTAPDPDLPLLAALTEAQVQRLRARAAEPIDPPAHWRLADTLSCRCADCKRLQAFLHADERTARFPLNKERRLHIHRQLDAQGCDVQHVTERRGRPYTLVCTKTRASWERKAERRAADLAALAKLGEEPSAPPG